MPCAMSAARRGRGRISREVSISVAKSSTEQSASRNHVCPPEGRGRGFISSPPMPSGGPMLRTSLSAISRAE
ncbi:conserved hypothetical protein [Ricinus communis]|uniref:Uncharacterized protein n=1 Tax=Ricinus communis TaxID=3988 RepID=B9TNC0_RICCO|nr:conserved hypothetical protein [Ricinus communis]